MAINHIVELICDPGSQNDFAIADTWVIDSYNSGDWTGTTGNLVIFDSDTPGSPVSVDISAIGIIYVSYFSAQDINFVGGTVYYDSTCTNVSGNTNFNPITDSPFVLVGGTWYQVYDVYVIVSGEWQRCQYMQIDVSTTFV
jgi:hypothetical protein